MLKVCDCRCAIGDGGVCAIADALDSDSTLRALDLKLNLFGDSGNSYSAGSHAVSSHRIVEVAIVTPL